MKTTEQTHTGPMAEMLNDLRNQPRVELDPNYDPFENLK